MSTVSYNMFCQQAYGKQNTLTQTIFQQLQEINEFYLIVSPGTTKENYEKKKFAVYVGPGQMLPVFLTSSGAKRKAIQANAVIDHEPTVMTATSQMLSAMLEKYQKANLVAGIRFYGDLPLFQEFQVGEWLNKELAQDMPVEEPLPEPQVPDKPQEFVGVKKLINMLDCQERSQIANFPTYSIFESFPPLLQKLMTANKITPDEMDRILELPEGVTAMTINNPKADVSKEMLKKYLGYFGMESYIYRYADNCQELQTSINHAPNICHYKIIPAKVSTVEPFELVDLRRAQDTEGAWLYRLVFHGEKRDQTCIVTSPLDMILNKKYELVGLEPLDQPKKEQKKENEIDAMISKEKEKFEEEQRSYLEKRKDQVIRYFKLHNPEGKTLQFKEAEAHYKRMARNDDLLDEFFWTTCATQKMLEELKNDPEYQRRKENQPKPVRVRDYTAEKLRKEFQLKGAWKPYFYLADLREHPRNTLQQLKYLKTDPQYQNQKEKTE